MPKTNSSTGALTAAESHASTFIMYGLVSVSIMQASSFMLPMATTPIQQIWLVCTVVFLLLGSQMLTRLAGISWGQGRFVLCVLLMMGVGALEAFSVATSTAALSGRVEAATRSQNLSSPEYKMAMSNVANYQRQIDDLRNNQDNLPANWVTKRNDISREITGIQARMERAQNAANSVSVSTTGRAMQGIKDSIGVTSSDISSTAAVMQSCTPLLVNLAIGILAGQRRRKIDGGYGGSDTKKPQPTT